MSEDEIRKELIALRERLVRLEAKVEAHTQAEDRVSLRLDAIDANLGALNAVLNQAKGARWALMLVAALGGGGVYAFVQRIMGMSPPPGSGP